MSFTPLNLSADLLQTLAARGYREPTPIQAEAVPAILAGRDVRACAQTGSGKTAAYGLALLQQFQMRSSDGSRPMGVLVLVPTRELASQVGGTMYELAARLPRLPKVCAVFGGVSINPQMMRLRGGVDFLIATPGRLLDLVDHNAVRLAHFGTLVLDEADRLLDLGFADELARVLDALPAQRQNLFFSATFPSAVQALADGLLRDPVRIDIAPVERAEPAITQRAIRVDAAQRTPLLRHLIAEHGWSRVLVFVATQYAAEHVADKLRRAGVSAEPLHGELSQGKRTQVLQDFKASRIAVVVATDLAARGIDIEGLPAVVNHDLPRSPVDHVHRIGRTGRAGLGGVAVSFITAEAEAHFKLIEKRQGQALPREVIVGFEPLDETAPAPLLVDASGNGGIKGRRPSKKDKLRAAKAALEAVGDDEASASKGPASAAAPNAAGG